MSILKDVLRDEYEKLKSLVQWYKEEVASLPKGSISIKKRKNREYLYLNYSEKNKVKSDYVGHVISEKAIEMTKKKIRRRIENNFKRFERTRASALWKENMN